MWVYYANKYELFCVIKKIELNELQNKSDIPLIMHFSVISQHKCQYGLLPISTANLSKANNKFKRGLQKPLNQQKLFFAATQ